MERGNQLAIVEQTRSYDICVAGAQATCFEGGVYLYYPSPGNPLYRVVQPGLEFATFTNMPEALGRVAILLGPRFNNWVSSMMGPAGA